LNKIAVIPFLVALILGISATDLAAQVAWTDVAPDLTFSNDGDIYSLDMNNDGITDFVFHLSEYSTSNSYDGMITIEALGNNTVLALPDDSFANVFYPNRLDFGNVIDSDGGMCSEQEQFMSVFMQCECCCPQERLAGEWNGATDHYLGLSVAVNGDNYYGWALLDAMSKYDTYLTIKEYAIAEIPNTQIPAGYKGMSLSVPEPDAPEEWGIFFQPQNELILIDASNNELADTDYYICSANGQKIAVGEITPLMTISTYTWRAGYYFMYLNSANLGEAVIKFLVH
jgi:hypothetical protein